MDYLLLEIKKILKLPTYRFMTLFILLVLFIKNILPVFSSDKSRFNWVNSLAGSFELLAFLGGFGVIIIAVQFTISEYQNRTLQLSLASGISRSRFLISKIIALMFGTYLLVFIGMIFSFLLLICVGSIIGNFQLSNLNNIALLKSFFLLPLKLFPLLFIAFFLTVFTRSSIIPISSLIFYASIGEYILTYFLIGTFLDKFLNFFPNKIILPINTVTVDILNTDSIDKLSIDTSSLSLTPGLLGILGYVVFFSFMTYLIFHEQDLSR